MSSETELDTGTGGNKNNSWGFYIFSCTVVATFDLFTFEALKKKHKMYISGCFKGVFNGMSHFYGDTFVCSINFNLNLKTSTHTYM